ncbi:phosphatidylglycerophosphatase A [Alphaproteobacteria bacterium]|nr:phosphatidylglycerophosphatase A [Alphaproteobacteria bacterium]
MINQRKILIFLSKIAEVYPLGAIKYAPGTIASFIAVIIGYNIITFLGFFNYFLITCITIIAGYFLCEIHISLYNKKDPKEVVIDEFGGQFIVLFATIESENLFYNFMSLTLSFLLFRFFDITKIGPIKRFEALPGGLGIMADDVIAGLCAFIVQCAILTALNQQILIKVL